MPRFSKYFDGNQYFPKILTKINTSENFDPNQEFYKFWPKSRFSKFLTKFDNLKILAKIKIEDKSRIRRILTKIEIFKNFDQNWDFPKILTKIHIFGNYDQNRDFSKILTKIKIFWKLRPMPRFSTEINIFRKFWPKSTFSKILTQIKNFINFDQNQDFRKFWQNRDNLQFLTKFDNLKILAKIKIEDKSRIPRILTEIEIFKNFDQNRDFRKPWLK